MSGQKNWGKECQRRGLTGTRGIITARAVLLTTIADMGSSGLARAQTFFLSGRVVVLEDFNVEIHMDVDIEIEIEIVELLELGCQ